MPTASKTQNGMRLSTVSVLFRRYAHLFFKLSAEVCRVIEAGKHRSIRDRILTASQQIPRVSDAQAAHIHGRRHRKCLLKQAAQIRLTHTAKGGKALNLDLARKMMFTDDDLGE